MIHENKNDIELFSPELTEGDTEIWYIMATAFKDNVKHILHGKDTLLPRTRGELQRTHKLLMKVKGTNPENLFTSLQGEVWCESSYANNLITEKGVSHTTMMPGDIIIIGTTGYFCASIGWKKFVIE